MIFLKAEDINKESYMEYYNSWVNCNEKIIPWSADLAGKTFEEWKALTLKIKCTNTCPKDLVIADTYFLLKNESFIIHTNHGVPLINYRIDCLNQLHHFV